MKTISTTSTVDDLLWSIYNDNIDHFDSPHNAQTCLDPAHITLLTILAYSEE